MVLPKALRIASEAAPDSKSATRTPKANISDRGFVARSVLAAGGIPVLVALVCGVASLKGFCLRGWFENLC